MAGDFSVLDYYFDLDIKAHDNMCQGSQYAFTPCRLNKYLSSIETVWSGCQDEELKEIITAFSYEALDTVLSMHLLDRYFGATRAKHQIYSIVNDYVTKKYTDCEMPDQVKYALAEMHKLHNFSYVIV